MGERFLSLFKSYDHTAIERTDAALLKRLANEGAVFANNEMAKLHLMPLEEQVLTEHLTLHSLSEGRQLVVTSYNLNFVAREDEVVAVRNIQAMIGSENTRDVNAILAAQLKLTQRMAHPAGIHGYVKLGHVYITIKQASLVEYEIMTAGVKRLR